MTKSIIMQPHELISEFSRVLGTSILCKVESCTAPELSKMKTPRDEHNRGYHRESCIEKTTDLLNAARLQSLDDVTDDQVRDETKALLEKAGSTFARLCGGYFISAAASNAIVDLLKSIRPELFEC